MPEAVENGEVICNGTPHAPWCPGRHCQARLNVVDGGECDE